MKRSVAPRNWGPVLLLLLLPAFVACSQADETTDLPSTLTAQDAPWPRQFAAGGTAVTIHQPQIESWQHYRRISFRAAVSFNPVASEGAPPNEGAEKTVFGALRIEADTDTDLENRSVLVGNMEIAGSHFAGLDEQQSAEWTEALRGVLPEAPMPVDLDRILAYFEHAGAEAVPADIGQGRAASGAASGAARGDLAHDAPRIFVSQEPAILVMLDGEPVLYPVEGTGLMFAVNTNWDLFFDSKAGRYYLLDLVAPEDDAEGAGEAFWLTAAGLDGPWTVADQLPPDFLKLPEGEDWAKVRQHLEAPGAGSPPAVFTATRPAELIVIDGPPALVPIGDSRLMWVQNTDADLFLFGGEGRYYYLVSGRWFSAASLEGPWQLASAELPAEFAAIPADHQKADVLASVPGTAQAEEAVRLAQVPTKATVQRDEATAEVAYQGEPEFKEIEGTSMEYAANTQSDVIKVGDVYYLCLQGVWFNSTSATGPWQVADSVADEIYDIPPSSPVHHTTYVEVYDSGPDWVTVGYTAAYLGLMVAIFDDAPVVVYGSGWYYPPYVYYGPRPIYYPYAHTYGAAAWYNPATGTYGRGARVYGPYGGAGRGAAYNPRTGTYARGASAWGPYGGTAAVRAYNPRTDTYRAGYRSATPYASWGEGVVERGDKWAHGARYSDARGTVSGVRTSEGDRALAKRTDSGRGFVAERDDDVYAGRNGQVYRRGDDGWSRYDDGDWNAVETRDRQSAGTEQRNRAELENRASASAASASQRSEIQDRASQAGERARAQGWDRYSSQGDAVRQLDADARARVQGSNRAEQFRAQGGAAGARSRAGRGRGGRRR